MTSFRNFRNRGNPPRSGGDGPPAAAPPATHSTATELGPQHMDLLREIEAEGEPLTLAEEIAELADRGALDEAAAKLDSLNKQGETHIAELQRMSMPQLIEEARKEKL